MVFGPTLLRPKDLLTFQVLRSWHAPVASVGVVASAEALRHLAGSPGVRRAGRQRYTALRCSSRNDQGFSC